VRIGSVLNQPLGCAVLIVADGNAVDETKKKKENSNEPIATCPLSLDTKHNFALYLSHHHRSHDSTPIHRRHKAKKKQS